MIIVEQKKHPKMRFHAKGFDFQEGYKFKIRVRDQFVETGVYLHWFQGKPSDIGIDISCMSGCVEKCKFCSAANFYNFTLTPEELVIQVEIALKQLHLYQKDFIDYVYKNGWLTFSYQGIGEPCHCPDIIQSSMDLMEAKFLDRCKIQFTVSSLLSNVGVIQKWNRRTLHTMQFSMHGADDFSRQELLRYKGSSLDDIKIALLKLRELNGSVEIKVNYLLIENKNDSEDQMIALLHFVENSDFYLKLSYVNPTDQAKRANLRSPQKSYFEKAYLFCKERHEKTYIYGSFQPTYMSCGELADYEGTHNGNAK